MTEPRSVGETLDHLEELAQAEPDVSLGDFVDAFGNRSYGPFLLVPALFVLSPLGAIPAFPTVMGIVIALFAAQIAFGRTTMWLPRLLSERSVAAEKLQGAVAGLRPVAGVADRWFHGRLEVLTKGVFVRVAAGLAILLAATVPPLELLPLASAAPMTAIALFGLALLVRDGALMIVAALVAGAAFALGLGFLR